MISGACTNLFLIGRISGVYNARCSSTYHNERFCVCIAYGHLVGVAFCQISWFRIKLVYGDMAAMLLNGSRISAEKIRHRDLNLIMIPLQDRLENPVSQLLKASDYMILFFLKNSCF